MTELPIVEIFTDGACRGNPGPGGWAALIRMGEKEKEVAGGEPLTTNNRMELMAAIKGLEAPKRPCRLVKTVTPSRSGCASSRAVPETSATGSPSALSMVPSAVTL